MHMSIKKWAETYYSINMYVYIRTYGIILEFAITSTYRNFTAIIRAFKRRRRRRKKITFWKCISLKIIIKQSVCVCGSFSSLLEAFMPHFLTLLIFFVHSSTSPSIYPFCAIVSGSSKNPHLHDVTMIWEEKNPIIFNLVCVCVYECVWVWRMYVSVCTSVQFLFALWWFPVAGFVGRINI